MISSYNRPCSYYNVELITQALNEVTKNGPAGVMTHIGGGADGTLLTGLSYWVSQ